MKRVNRVLLAALLALCLGGAGTASAGTLEVGGLGLDFGGACLSTAASCPAAFDFVVTPTVSVTGDVTYTAGPPGFPQTGTLDFELDLADFSITGSGHDGVEEILFTGLHLSLSGAPTLNFGGGPSGGTGTATLTGSYEQLDGGGGTVVGPIALNDPVFISGLSCNTVALQGQCGFTLETPGFALSVGSGSPEDHDLLWQFNLLVGPPGSFPTVPEPSTTLMVGMGLVALASRRRLSNR